MVAVADSPEGTRACEANAVYIGEGVAFKGELTAPELVVVDGVVEGDVQAKFLRVGATGSLKGSVIVTDADIHGSVSDKLEVKRLLIVRSTGRIEAEITYGELQIEKGAVISGTLASNDARSATGDQKSSKPKRTQAPPLELMRAAPASTSLS